MKSFSRLCMNVMRSNARMSHRFYSKEKISPSFDFEYLCSEANLSHIENNIKHRKGVGDIRRVVQLHKELLNAEKQSEKLKVIKLTEELIAEAKKIPNKTHPSVVGYGEEARVVKTINEKAVFDGFEPFEFGDLTRRLNLMRTDQLGSVTGHRSYFFMGELAELEEALIKYTVSLLLSKGFQLVSVPDILPSHIIESCGMNVDGDRTQIYSLDASHHGPELCLSGTAEMSLAGLLMHSRLPEAELPLKLAAVSRCYRAETSSVNEQKGIYRVHQFTKVEMFGVTTPQASESLLEEFLSIEEESFSNLGLHLRVLDMPPHELGAPAYRKYDVEAWMPGRKMFGEISSCSNCTDYQSRRLDIAYIPEGARDPVHAHTLNGTACAVPRMLVAILESNQQNNGKITIPPVLRQYMAGKQFIAKHKAVPELKLVKVKV